MTRERDWFWAGVAICFVLSLVIGIGVSCAAPPRAPDPHRCAACKTSADTMEIATVEVYDTQFRRFWCLTCGRRWAVVK